MDRDEFIASVMARIDRSRPPDGEVAAYDRDAVLRHIGQCYDEDFTADDAYKFVLLTEEVNPHINEETACRRMGEIRARYVPSKGPK